MPGEIWSTLPDFKAHGGALQMGGHSFELKGVNWFGAEGPEQAPNGLWLHSLEWYLDFIAGAGFNAIRVPFALDNIRANAVPSANMITASPELAGLTVLDLLERLVDRAAAHGLLVLFDLHRLQVRPCPHCTIPSFELFCSLEVSHRSNPPLAGDALARRRPVVHGRSHAQRRQDRLGCCAGALLQPVECHGRRRVQRAAWRAVG